MDTQPSKLISNFANQDRPKVIQVISVTGSNFLMEEEAKDSFGKILPHAFSVWSQDGRIAEFWAIYESMFPDDDPIGNILTKWNLPS